MSSYEYLIHCQSDDSRGRAYLDESEYCIWCLFLFGSTQLYTIYLVFLTIKVGFVIWMLQNINSKIIWHCVPSNSK